MREEKVDNKEIEVNEDTERRDVQTSDICIRDNSIDSINTRNNTLKDNIVRKLESKEKVVKRRRLSPSKEGVVIKEKIIKTGLLFRGGVKSIGNRAGNISIEKILALKNAGMKVKDIAERLGTTEQRIEDEINVNADYVEFCNDKTQAFNRLMYSLYKELGVKDIQKMTPYQRVISIGVLYDKLNSYKERSVSGVETSIRLAIIELDKKTTFSTESKVINQVSSTCNTEGDV